METLHIGERTYQLPKSMNEMTVEQLVALSELVATDLPIQEIKVKFLFHCLGAHVKRMKNQGYFRIKIGNDTFALTVEEIANVSTVFDYLYTKPDTTGQCFFDNRLTANPYPELTLNKLKFYSPKDAMTDMLYNQYIYLQTYDVMKERKPEAVYAWLGCMFRRNKSVFNPDDLNLDYMKKLKAEQIVLMLWFWIGSCRFISDKFPRIFPLPTGESSESNPYDGQQKLLDFIANSDPEKKRAYKADKLYDILYSLDSILEKEENKKE